MEESMSEGNVVLSMYAAFACVLLSSGYIYKVIRDRREERQNPHLDFEPKSRPQNREEQNELAHTR
jgi:hypothetical protein